MQSSAPQAKHSDVLFDVLTHPQSQHQFGIGESSDRSTLIIELHPPCAAQITRTTTVNAVRCMAEKLRQGFHREGKPMHFDAIEQRFTHMHPDLSWGGRKWTIAAKPADISVGLQTVNAEMASVDPSLVSTVEVNAWCKRQLLNASYLVAFDDLPVWTLVLADVAMRQGWPVRANPLMKGAPAHLPSTNPKDWEEWLSQTFDKCAIQGATRLLGHTSIYSTTTDQALIDEGNWSSLL